MNGKTLVAIILIIIAIVFWVFALTRKPAYKRNQEAERQQKEIIVEVEQTSFIFEISARS